MKTTHFALTLLFVIGFLSNSYSQGTIPIKGGSYLGALEFLPNGKIAEGYNRVKSPFQMADPTIDPKNWYQEGEKSMRGIVKDAVLFIEWWTTASSPLERSKFDWMSSGYFEINYVDSKGQNKFQRIDRYKLDKYPNLLKRFDNLKPIDIDFEISFESVDLPDKEYYAFRKKYKIMESLGSAGYAVVYTRKINGDFVALNRSGEKQEWTNPGMNLGGWKNFLNIPASLADKESRLIELFKIGRGLHVINFKISKIKWRLDDFIYIAKKYEDYESGKDKPTAFDEVANGEQEKKAGDGFWDETTEMPCAIDLVKDLNNSVTNEGVVTFSGRVTGPKSMIKSGKVLAEGYEQDFAIDNNGDFSISVVLSAGVNNIKLSICSKIVQQKITLNREPVDLRVTMTWDKPASDIDLYLYDPDAMVCFYKQKTASNMQLDVDNTSGYGPENIYVKKVKKGTYTIKAVNYKNGENSEVKIYVFINEKLKEIHKIRFITGEKEIIVYNYKF